MPSRRQKSIVVIVVSVVGLQAATVLAVPRDATTDRGAHRANSPTPVVGNLRTPSPAEVALSPAFDALGVTLLSQVTPQEFPTGATGANDVWGYVSPQGREYAIVGLNVGTGFVDVTDPANPAIVAGIPDATSLWSDMAVYGDYVYNVNESGGGMQVIDVSRIDEGIVTLVGALTDSALRTAHNVYVNPQSGFAYLCGANSPVQGLVAVDVSDPANPTMAGIWPSSPPSVYAHDVYVTSYDVCPYSGRSGPCEIAFAFCGGAGFYIVDVTDKADMTTIWSTTYPNIAYCHQGWLTEDKTHVLFGDELDESGFNLLTTTHVVRVADLDNPEYLGTFHNSSSAIDHNLLIRGNYVFEANYTSGLRIYDISDLGNPQEIGYFDTFPSNNARMYDGAWGVYPHLPSGIVLISDMTGGLFVLNASEAVGCQADAHCTDGNPCTTDTCDPNGDCVHDLLPPDTLCEDGDVCTIDGQCDGDGDCVSTDITTLPCSDDGPCAPGTCDTETGFCVCFACAAVDEPIQEATTVEASRYLSFAPANPGLATALRVTFTDLPAPFEDHIGQSMWVGQPREVCENGGEDVPPPSGCSPTPGLANDSFMAAPLECEPVFGDWGSIGTVHVFGDAVVPGGEFGIQAISFGCYQAGLPNYSIPLPVTSSMWGDLVSDCSTTPCGPPDGDVSLIRDCVAILDKFVNGPRAVIKARADLEPGTPDQKINITDVVLCIGAFVGDPYPGPGPPDCP